MSKLVLDRRSVVFFWVSIRRENSPLHFPLLDKTSRSKAPGSGVSMLLRVIFSRPLGRCLIDFISYSDVVFFIQPVPMDPEADVLSCGAFSRQSRQT